MYSVSLDTSLIFPSVATASVTTYPTTLLTNTFAPSIVYERHIGAPVFPDSIPLVGIECQNRTKKKEELVDEKKIDDLIKKRVEEQLIEYQQQEEKQRQEEKKYFHNDCHCHCTKHREETELTLDEKIERIREELNLTKERDEDKLIKKLHEYQKRYEKATNTHKIDNNLPLYYKDDYKINYLESSSNIDSKVKRTKSRSPSRNRSHWVPTGSNDYTNTNLKREELVNKQRNYIPCDSEPSTSLVFFDHEKPKVDNSRLVTIETYKPAQTIFETTVDSKTMISERPIPKKEYYCTTNYVTDHYVDSSKSKSKYVTNTHKEPIYYETTVYPLAKEYYYHPIERKKSFYV